MNAGPARRELAVAVLLCLVGAFVVLVAAGRPWVELVVLSPLVGDRVLAVPGADLSPGVRALGLVGLAGVVAVAATRRTGRVVVGVLLLAVGVGVVALSLGLAGDDLRALDTAAVREAGGSVGDPRGTAWPYACAAGGLLLAAAGALVAARGRRWAALSQRYEAPAARATEAPTPERAERELWESLDRGEDPTGRG